MEFGTIQGDLMAQVGSRSHFRSGHLLRNLLHCIALRGFLCLNRLCNPSTELLSSGTYCLVVTENSSSRRSVYPAGLGITWLDVQKVRRFLFLDL